MFLFRSYDVLYQLALFNYCFISFYIISILYSYNIAWSCSWTVRPFFVFRIHVIQMETSFQQKSQERHIFDYIPAYDQLKVGNHLLRNVNVM